MKQTGWIKLWRKYFHILFLRPVIKLIFGVNVIGNDNFDGLNQFVIIANHNSHLDILLLFKILPVHAIVSTRPIAEEVYFSRNRLVYNLVQFVLNPIWVKRGKIVKQTDPFKDTKTGLIWCLMDSLTEKQQCLYYPSAVEYVTELKTGGYEDWRLPT